MRKQYRAVVAMALIAMLLLGCSARRWDTDEINNPTTTQPVRFSRDVEGVVASITALLSQSTADLSHWAPALDEASCVADRLVRRFTAEGLLERGFDPNQATLALAYSAEDRVAAINVLVGCVDFTTGMIALWSSYDKLPMDDAICMARGVKRLGLDRDFAGSLVDATEPDPFANGYRFGNGLAQLAEECLALESLFPGVEPGSLPDPLPGAPTQPESADSSTTTTAPVTGGGLEGIVPGGPLDTSGG